MADDAGKVHAQQADDKGKVHAQQPAGRRRYNIHMLLLLQAEHHFSWAAAAIGIVLLLVLSIPLGFLIAFLLRRWHERHPIEEAQNEKHPLGLE